MKAFLMIALTTMLAISSWAQTASTIFHREGPAVVDSSGNLVVFDEGRSTTGVTVTGLRHSFFAPVTRVTVQHPGTTGNTQTVSYDAALHVIGVGSSAIYAIATAYTVSGTTVTTTSNLIAIRAGQALPPSISGFASFALTSPTDVKLGPSDYLALITENRTSTTTSRTATVVHFNGASFDPPVSSGTLP
jgi:hypothetical protein